MRLKIKGTEPEKKLLILCKYLKKQPTAYASLAQVLAVGRWSILSSGLKLFAFSL